MEYRNQITDSIYYIGVNDRTKQLFEGSWSLPHGVSYNSYLLVGEQVVLIDGVEIGTAEKHLGEIKAIIGDRPIDYLIVNHMEPDHSGSIGLLRTLYPEMKVVGNAKTFGMLDSYFAPIPQEQRVVVSDKEPLEVGNFSFQFVMAPMVHWPEVMFTYESSNNVLFTADAFGTFGALNGAIIDRDMNLDLYYEEMYRYYACIVGKFGMFVQKALEKYSSLGLSPQYICPTHGPVWTEHGFPQALAIYDQLSKYDTTCGAVILYGSMYGHNEQMAEAVAQGLAQSGIKDIVVHNVSTADPSHMLRDIFKYRALIVGAPTYCNSLFSPMRDILNKVALREVKHRIIGYFGSCTWAGQAIKIMPEILEKLAFEQVTDPVEIKGAATPEQLAQGRELGVAIAKRLLELYH